MSLVIIKQSLIRLIDELNLSRYSHCREYTKFQADFQSLKDCLQLNKLNLILYILISKYVFMLIYIKELSVRKLK